MKLIAKSALIGLGLTMGLPLIGCSKSEPTVITAPNEAGGRQEAAGGGGGAPGKVGAGATSDTSVRPAPAGVKTGLEGGKKD